MMRSQPTVKYNVRRSLAAVLIAIVFLTACSGSGSDSAASSSDDGPTLAGYEREPGPIVGSISLPAANRDTDAFVFQAEPSELPPMHLA